MINYCVSMGVDLERGPLTNLDNKLAQEMTEQEGEAMDSNKMSRSIAEKTAKLHRSGVNIWPKRDKKNLRFVQLKTHNFRSIISISLQILYLIKIVRIGLPVNRVEKFYSTTKGRRISLFKTPNSQTTPFLSVQIIPYI